MSLRITKEQYAALQGKRSKSKYGNKRTDGYHSAREAKRAKELRLLEASGEIRNLKEQVPYEIIPAVQGERAIFYVADFVYEIGFKAPADDTCWMTIVEDCKGFRTREYALKRRLMLLRYGVRILET